MDSGNESFHCESEFLRVFHSESGFPKEHRYTDCFKSRACKIELRVQFLPIRTSYPVNNIYIHSLLFTVARFILETDDLS